MMDLSSLFYILNEIINYFSNNNETFLFIVPKLLQIIGMIGWLYEGFQLGRDYRSSLRIRNFIRMTMVWLIGLMLEKVIIIYLSFN